MLLMPRGGAAILYLGLGSNQIVSRVTVTYSRVGPREAHSGDWAGVYRWKERHSHMKTLTITDICLPIAAMILTVALAIPAAAGDLVPFKGTMQGHDTDTPCSPPQSQCVVVTTTGTGIGTHLGDFSFTQVHKVNRAAGTGAGSAHCSPGRSSLRTAISKHRFARTSEGVQSSFSFARRQEGPLLAFGD